MRKKQNDIDEKDKLLSGKCLLLRYQFYPTALG